MNTGEHQTLAIDSDTPIRAGLVVSVVGAALVLAGVAGAAHFRISATEKEQDASRVELESVKREQSEQKVEAAVLKEAFKNQTETLKEIKSAIERMEGRGIRPARYREER